MSHRRRALKVMVMSAGTAMVLTACTTNSDDRSAGAEPIVSGVSEGSGVSAGAVSKAPLGMTAKKARTYKLLGAYTRWNPCRRITYRVNASGMPRGASKDIHGAFRRMSRATGIRFTYKGTTTGLPGKRGKPHPAAKVWRARTSCSPSPAPTRSATSATPLGSAVHTGAAAGRTSRPASADTSSSTVSTRSRPDSTRGPRHGLQGTRGQLYMHEIGHVVGRDHVTVRSQIMYPTMTRKPATFGAGDRRGLRLLGRSQGCVKE